MFRTIPCVEGIQLYLSETSADTIIVGTAAWYDWLEQHTSFTFVDRIFGYFLAHKRRTASGEFTWEASLTRARKLRCAVLGPAQTLSLPKLQKVAQILASPNIPAEGVEVSTAEPGTSQFPIPKPAIQNSSYNSLLHTKLYQPYSGNDTIPRPRLMQRLDAGLDHSITLVCAPAGFGKTTLLVEWTKTLERKVVWLTLDETDNELSIFVRSLTAALQNVVSDTCQASTSLLAAPLFPSSESVATLLSNDLADIPEDIVLVLDDYHLIHTTGVHTLLELLIQHLPSQVHLVLATRSDPALPLVKWLAHGYLNELRGADLRFTLEETEAFLTRIVGEKLAQQTAQALEEWSGGWIAVLRLAALSLSSASHPFEFLKRLRSHPDRLVSRYLLEEILLQQAPSIQKLLERASMLGAFCIELCVAICGNNSSYEQVQTTLSRLERSNLFLVPLDDRQGWYRFHPLFKLLLLRRLQAHCTQEELASLHQRASVWYAEQGLIEEAIKQALAAEDEPEAAKLVEARVLEAFEREQWVQMDHWLHLLPEKQIKSSPSLLFAKVWILQVHGQLTDIPSLLTTAEQLLDSYASTASASVYRQLKILHALIAIERSHFQYFTGQAQASLQSAHTALEWTPQGETHIVIHALFFLTMASQATGHEELALMALNTALREPSAHLNNTARLLLAQAILYLTAGKLAQVEQTARHLLQVAQDAHLTLSQFWAHRLLGMVYYEWNHLDAAAYHFSIVIANRHLAHFWAVQDAMCGLALVYQVQGLAQEAQQAARALLDWIQDQHNLPQLLTAYAFCGHLALVRGELESAQQWLELAGQQARWDPMLFLEDPALTRAWEQLAQGDQRSVAQGQALLATLLEHVRAIHNTRKTITVLALEAWAYELQGKESQALETLEQALMLARPGGFIRSFVDLPQLGKLLRELRRRHKAQQVLDKPLEAYLQRILAAMHSAPDAGTSTTASIEQEGLEPLTERELHILRLLDKELTNKEIARELVITPGTVKVHTNNVYRKLSVNNRRAAVTLSKALGLLAVN